MQAAMRTTPEEVKWWRFRSLRNERAESLLLIKFHLLNASAFSELFGSRPIYEISVGELQGFEIGDPNSKPFEAHLDLFDAHDRHYAFGVSAAGKHGQQLVTQAEVNSMVNSIQPTMGR